jgi:hypothetical protein
MAKARIVHYWPAGEGKTVFEVEPNAAMPDGLDEACRQVTRMWRDVCAEPGLDVDALLAELDDDEASE